MRIVRKRKKDCTHDYGIFTGVLFNRRPGESGCTGDHVHAGGIFIYSSLDERAGLEKYSVDDALCVFADEKSEITQEGMDVLASIGVFAEASAEKSLTRAEAAKLLLYMLESK